MIMEKEQRGGTGADTADIRLISLDFDGTLLVYDDPAGVFHPEVIRLLNSLEERGIRWCANSGREFHDQKEVVARSRQRGLNHEPDAFICSESVVFWRSGNTYESLEPWNQNAHACLRAFHRNAQARLESKLESIQKTYAPAAVMTGELYTAFLLRDHGPATLRLAGDIERYLEGLDEVMITRNGGWVAVMHQSLGKGNALKAYARHIGLPADHILAIGDHHNDLPMLDREIARHVGCPGDAIPEVQQAVRRAGGIIADEAGPVGTVNVIHSLVSGTRI